MASDLERAFAALDGKRAGYTTLWAYYDGVQPVVYTNRRLEEIFRDVDARFTENWCAVVVDSVHERLRLKGFTASDGRAQEALDSMWATGDLGLEADDAHLAALVTGEAFLVGWWDDENGVQCYYNDPRLCHVFYDAENPRRATFAAKWWDTDDGYRRLTLYYADRLEYYASTKKADNITNARAFAPLSGEAQAANPFGQIPVFHLRTGRRPVSELVNAVPLQNGVNKLLIDMMVAAEYSAFKQRWVISQSGVLGKVKNAPNEIWDIPAGDGDSQGSQVGEFTATDLGNYLTAVDKLSTAIGIITRTPKHYFFAQGGDPSGEALIAMEAPLNHKAERRIARFATTWRQVAAFLLWLQGLEVDAATVTPIFEQPETIQPLTRAQVRQFDIAAGIPLRTSLRREGWSKAELAQMDEDAAAATVTGEQLGDRLLGAFDRGQ